MQLASPSARTNTRKASLIHQKENKGRQIKVDVRIARTQRVLDPHLGKSLKERRQGWAAIRPIETHCTLVEHLWKVYCSGKACDQYRISEDELECLNEIIKVLIKSQLYPNKIRSFSISYQSNSSRSPSSASSHGIWRKIFSLRREASSVHREAFFPPFSACRSATDPQWLLLLSTTLQ